MLKKEELPCYTYCAEQHGQSWRKSRTSSGRGSQKAGKYKPRLYYCLAAVEKTNEGFAMGGRTRTGLEKK